MTIQELRSYILDRYKKKISDKRLYQLIAERHAGNTSRDKYLRQFDLNSRDLIRKVGKPMQLKDSGLDKILIKLKLK